MKSVKANRTRNYEELSYYSGGAANVSPASQFIRQYYHTSDGERPKMEKVAQPEEEKNFIYSNQKEDITIQPYNFTPMSNKNEKCLSNISMGRMSNSDSIREEESPFYLKRRIRSSNPHARTKRTALPLISKAFFKHTRDGQRTPGNQLNLLDEDLQGC